MCRNAPTLVCLFLRYTRSATGAASPSYRAGGSAESVPKSQVRRAAAACSMPERAGSPFGRLLQIRVRCATRRSKGSTCGARCVRVAGPGARTGMGDRLGDLSQSLDRVRAGLRPRWPRETHHVVARDTHPMSHGLRASVPVPIAHSRWLLVTWLYVLPTAHGFVGISISVPIASYQWPPITGEDVAIRPGFAAGSRAVCETHSAQSVPWPTTRRRRRQTRTQCSPRGRPPAGGEGWQ